jgi:hypothetical protein
VIVELFSSTLSVDVLYDENSLPRVDDELAPATSRSWESNAGQMGENFRQVGTRKDLREVSELHAAGKTRVIRETRRLDGVNEAIADVEASQVAARIVLEP